MTIVTFRSKHRESLDGIKIVSAGTVDGHLDKFRGLRRLYKTARKTNADVYHFHDPGLLPVGVMLARRSDGRVIYDCHEDYSVAFRFYSFPPDLLNPVLPRLMPRLESAVVSQLDGVVTANDPDAERFRQRGHGRVVNVRNFPLTEEIHIEEPPLERNHEYQLVYVGGLARVRGFMSMLKITKRLRDRGLDVGFWVLGSFSSQSLESEAKAFISQEGLDEAVTFCGYVEYEKIFSYLAAADIGLSLRNPSRYRVSIPTKLFEYMYAGIPVVAVDTDLNKNYLPETCGVLVPWDNVSTQTDAIEELLKDKERRQGMGQSGRQLVESRYSWEKESQRLLSLYDELT